MKRIIFLVYGAIGLALLTGCYINKKGNICSVTMPAFYCDADAYEQLMNPGWMVDRWDTKERSVEVRLTDWMACGGNSRGSYSLAPLPDGLQRTISQYNADSRVKVHGIYRCMMKKGYEYTDQCTSSVMRDSPPCRARAGEPWE